MKLLTKIRDRMSGKTLKRDVRFDGEGFAVVPYEKVPISVRWADVREIVALKHDLFSVDEICLEFYFDDSGHYVRVGEDDGEFAPFRAELERRFSLNPMWFSRVAQPPFAENRTSLWRRP